MGMSASQARLLQLTARMTDVTSRGQQLQAVKIQLSASQDALALQHANELSELSTMISESIASENKEGWKKLNGQMLLALGCVVNLEGVTAINPEEHPEPTKDAFVSNQNAFDVKYPSKGAYDEAIAPSANYQVETVEHEPVVDEETGEATTPPDTYKFGGTEYTSYAEASQAAKDARNAAINPTYEDARNAEIAKDQAEYEEKYSEWETKYKPGIDAWNTVSGWSAEDIAKYMSAGNNADGVPHLEIFKDNNANGIYDEGDSAVSDYVSTDVLNAAYKAREDAATADFEAKMKKLATKEKIIDMEIKQLDTEYNALKTEHDSLKAVIKDNTEKTFGIFNG